MIFESLFKDYRRTEAASADMTDQEPSVTDGSSLENYVCFWLTSLLSNNAHLYLI